MLFGVNKRTHGAVRFLPRALKSGFDVTAAAKKEKKKKRYEVKWGRRRAGSGAALTLRCQLNLTDWTAHSQ